MLMELHAGHPGVVRMKAIACSYIWWPGLDAQIEEQAKRCALNEEPSTLFAAHLAMARVAMATSSCGLCQTIGRSRFWWQWTPISKWPEVQVKKPTTTDKTIQALRSIFGRYWLPEVRVSDNGLQFTSPGFGTFLKRNGVKHMRTPSFHPATNGQAECFVQTLKRSLKASRGTLTLKFPNTLFQEVRNSSRKQDYIMESHFVGHNCFFFVGHNFTTSCFLLPAGPAEPVGRTVMLQLLLCYNKVFFFLLQDTHHHPHTHTE